VKFGKRDEVPGQEHLPWSCEGTTWSLFIPTESRSSRPGPNAVFERGDMDLMWHEWHRV